MMAVVTVSAMLQKNVDRQMLSADASYLGKKGLCLTFLAHSVGAPEVDVL